MVVATPFDSVAEPQSRHCSHTVLPDMEAGGERVISTSPLGSAVNGEVGNFFHGGVMYTVPQAELVGPPPFRE